MHGRVVCELGHLVAQCRCINHNDDTIVAHSDRCGEKPTMAQPARPGYQGYKPFYGVELHEIAQNALDAAKDDDKAEEILVSALRRIEVNTRAQLMNYLVRSPQAKEDLAQAVKDTHKQAMSDYHSLNFWTGQSSRTLENENATQD